MKSLARVELRRALVSRRLDDHKGRFGHVLLVAGSAGMSGAAVLAARAALRSGAGLVTVAAPASLQHLLASAAPEAMTLGLPETSSGSLRSEGVGDLQRALHERGYTVLAIGPGLSLDPETVKFVLHVVSGLSLPIVLDADALNILAAQDPQDVRQMMRARTSPCVMTPHPGEMARCLRMNTSAVEAARQDCTLRLAQEWNGVALLKGRGSLISDGRRTALNATGGPGLAKGGSGDVLTGLIGGLWAQLIASGRESVDAAFAAAALGAHLHGKAGDLAEKDLTSWAMTAQDVINKFPAAFRSL